MQLLYQADYFNYMHIWLLCLGKIQWNICTYSTFSNAETYYNLLCSDTVFLKWKISFIERWMDVCENEKLKWEHKSVGRVFSCYFKNWKIDVQSCHHGRWSTCNKCDPLIGWFQRIIDKTNIGNAISNKEHEKIDIKISIYIIVWTKLIGWLFEHLVQRTCICLTCILGYNNHGQSYIYCIVQLLTTKIVHFIW